MAASAKRVVVGTARCTRRSGEIHLMRHLRALFLRLAALFGKDRRDRELAAELDAHLQLHIEDNLRAGMSPEQARRNAFMKLGGLEPTKELYRQRSGIPLLEMLVQDLGYGLRTLRKNPGFTAVAILMVALGIGGNTAVFQVLDALIMQSLPVRNPQEIADIEIANSQGIRGSQESWHSALTNPLWEELRDRQQAFSGIFVWSTGLFNLSPGGEARWASGLQVSGGFFSTLGVQPAFGRLFADADDQRGCGSPGAVLSYSFWQSEYGGDPSAIGRKITLERLPFEIIGVAPSNFTGLEVGQRWDVATPLCAEDLFNREGSRMNTGVDWWLIAMGRLKPGWTLEKARAHLAAISPGIFQAALRPDYPKVSLPQYLKFTLTANPAGGGISQLREGYSRSLWFLFTTTGLVLLIACANLANLMLARGSSRHRELAVRAALGASRNRLMSQMLGESVVIAVVGAGIGVWLANILSRLLVQFLSTEGNPIYLPVGLDRRTLLFTSGAAIFTCILFGLAPALRARNASPGDALKAAGRGATSARAGMGLRRVLVVCQIAISLTLLVAALLFTHSFFNLFTADTGLRTQGVVISYLDLSRLNLPTDRRLEFDRELLNNLAQIPGVDSLGTTGPIPLTGTSWSNNVWVDGSSSSQSIDASFAMVSNGFFQTVGIRLLAGQSFAPGDDSTKPRVAIVNESFVRQLLHGGDALGKRFWREATPHDPETRFEIVGIVKDSTYSSLREGFRPTVYLADSQDPRPGTFLQLLVRSDLSSSAAISSLKTRIAQVSPDIVATFSVYDNVIRESMLQDRLMAWLSSFFGILAILLSAVGLYGVIAYMVAQRTNEVGVRMALGADGRNIVRLFLREIAVLLAIGCGIGSAMALALDRAAGSLLFGLKPHDPLTFAFALMLLASVAVAASYVPARRAAVVDPMVALRYE